MKRIKISILTLIAIFLLVSCGSQQVSSDESNEVSNSIENANTVSVDAKQYNKEICDGKYVTVTLTEIRADGVEFVVKNKLKNNPITVDINTIALDGQMPQEKSLGHNRVEVMPEDTAKALYETDIVNADHKLLSAEIIVYNEHGSGVENIDVSDFDIGGTANTDYEEPDGDVVYESENVTISYAGAMDNGLRLRCSNKTANTFNIALDQIFTVNAEEKDFGTRYAFSIPPKASRDYYIDVMSIDPDYSAENVKSFTLSGHIYNDYFEEDYNIEYK